MVLPLSVFSFLSFVFAETFCTCFIRFSERPILRVAILCQNRWFCLSVWVSLFCPMLQRNNSIETNKSAQQIARPLFLWQKSENFFVVTECHTYHLSVTIFTGGHSSCIHYTWTVLSHNLLLLVRLRLFLLNLLSFRNFLTRFEAFCQNDVQVALVISFILWFFPQHICSFLREN